jgi:hypothetical protein
MQNTHMKKKKKKKHILHATLLAKHSKGINDNLCFTLDLIQIIIDVVTLDYIPYIHIELHYTPLEEFLQSKFVN